MSYPPTPSPSPPDFLLILNSPSLDIFTSTPIAQALSTPTWSTSFPSLIKIYHPPMHHLPQYLHNLNYINPTADEEGIDSAFNIAHAIKSYWDWFREHPVEAKAFQAGMIARSKMAKRWYESYPVEEQLRALPLSNKPENEGHILLVNVGGGVGPGITSFHSAHPQLKGRLILQDLPEVLVQITSNPTITLLRHDFFTPQPPSAQNAAFYLLSNVLRDWGDASVRKILTHLCDAMQTGYSRILIHESMMEDKSDDVSANVAASDLLMMVMSNAMERTEGMWRELVEGVEGLEMKRVWGDKGAWKRVVEVGRVR